MEVPVYNLSGEVVRNITLSDDVFGIPCNESVMHQAVVAQLANARQGTASTKDRGDVKGSGIKLYRQKGTGRARRGSLRSPMMRHGGIAFGPHPRDYRQHLPKKVRQLAIRCALSDKATNGALVVLDDLDFTEPKTKEMVRLLAALKVESSALITTVEPKENVIKSARNIPGVKTLPASILNVLDIINHDKLLMTEAAAHRAEELWGKTASQGDSHGTV